MSKFVLSKVADYKSNKQGSFAIMASVSALVLMLSLGVVVDVSSAHSSKAKVQSLSDSLGLQAAIFIRDNDEPPTAGSGGFVQGEKYPIKDVAHGMLDPKLSGYFEFNYDDENQRVEVEFVGEVETTFMSAFHKPSVGIKASSTVKYPTVKQSAASVFLIVDNSGSMAWDDKVASSRSTSQRPAGAKRRIEGLKETAIRFNVQLEENVNSAATNTSERYLRTGLIPYSSSVITSKVSEPDWGVLEPNKITQMIASGGTDSRAPMDMALDWMEEEDGIHLAESGTTDAKKYVVFMTDGSNNEEWVCDWRDQSNTRLWRTYNGYKYTYRWSRWSPGGSWTEGVASNCNLENKSNVDSIATCNALKNEGVEVFTIGYALEPGYYFANYPSTAKVQISSSTTESAYNFLEGCASSEDHFIKAEDTEALFEAFDAIGAKITEDFIRILG